MRDLFTEHSTILVGGIVAILLLMRLALQFTAPTSGAARFILWFWHPEARAILGRLLLQKGTDESLAADRLRLEEIYTDTLANMNSTLVALALVFFVIRPFVVQAFFIPTASMYPTLVGDAAGQLSDSRRQDRVLVNRYVYHLREPRRQEIIVFHAPPAAVGLVTEGNEDFIKRLVAVPGDTIEVRDHCVYINGEPLNEPYIYLKDAYPGGMAANFGPLKVPPGKYFMMGDNRGNSHDSRLWRDPATGEPAPFIDREAILGKAMCVFWPPQAIRLLKAPPERATLEQE